MQKTIEKIAMDYLDIKILDNQNRDCLDFHEVSVWTLRAALEAAYKAGQKNAKN